MTADDIARQRNTRARAERLLPAPAAASRRRLEPSLVPDIDAMIPPNIPAESPASRMLRLYLGILRDQAALATAELRHLATRHVRELLAVAFDTARGTADIATDRSVAAARRRAIKADISDKLENGALSIADVSARHGVTPRYVQMLFEDEGITFTQFVLTQRLERAYRMLTDPGLAARSITSVAFDAGFGDLSYFNRTFRRRFGDTPSGVRSTIARHGPAPTLGDAIVKSITQTSLETGRSFAPVQADPATRS